MSLVHSQPFHLACDTPLTAYVNWVVKIYLFVASLSEYRHSLTSDEELDRELKFLRRKQSCQPTLLEHKRRGPDTGRPNCGYICYAVLRHIGFPYLGAVRESLASRTMQDDILRYPGLGCDNGA